jgi:hypothetical protein
MPSATRPAGSRGAQRQQVDAAVVDELHEDVGGSSMTEVSGCWSRLGWSRNRNRDQET